MFAYPIQWTIANPVSADRPAKRQKKTSCVFLENLAGSGCQSESGSNPERGLHPPLSDPAKAHKASHSHKLLCQSPQEPLPAGSITSAYRQKCSVQNQTSLCFFNRIFLVPKPNKKWSPPTSEAGVRSPHGLKWESW